jgi:putative ABC transport system substrate-binding protein
MQRRTFIASFAAVVSWPLAARAQQKAIPVIGFLRSTAAAPSGPLAQAFRDGLKDAGFVDGANVKIEYRYADGDAARLPVLAADLLRGGVSLIAGNSLAAEAAKRITSTVPIVFVTSDDPVQRGLVASLARPGGNATGFTFFGGGQLAAKRLEILHALVPRADAIGFLMDSQWPGSAADFAEVQAAAGLYGRRLVAAEAANEPELVQALAAIREAGAGGLIIAGAPAYSSRRATLIMQAARQSLPTIYDMREYVEEGGLISYSGSIVEAYRQAAIYAGKILKGTDPADLPVQQPTRIELVINLKTAKTLGITVPQSLLARADEIIE